MPQADPSVGRSVTVVAAVLRFRDAGKDEKDRRAERTRTRSRAVVGRFHANANKNSRIARKGGIAERAQRRDNQQRDFG